MGAVALFPLFCLPCMAGAVAPVAVTGGTGKLGRRAVEQLVANNVPVRVLLRQPPSAAAEASGAVAASKPQVAAWLEAMPGVTLVKGDVTDPASLNELLRGCSACLALHGVSCARSSCSLLDSLAG
mgnify:CR=1 FL=1